MKEPNSSERGSLLITKSRRSTSSSSSNATWVSTPVPWRGLDLRTTGRPTRLTLSKKCQRSSWTRSINRWLRNVRMNNTTTRMKTKEILTLQLLRLRQRGHCYQLSGRTVFCLIQLIKSKRQLIWKSFMKVGKSSRSSRTVIVKYPWCLLSTSRTISTSWTTGLAGYSSETATLITISLPT